MAVANFARRVLVVDDEPIIRTLLGERLAEFGFETFTAPDALFAKRVVLKEDPDALVVDLDLGDGPSGTELIAALSAMNPALGFVLLTNYTPTASELRSAKNIEYLNKREVADVAAIVSALDRVLQDQGAASMPQPGESKLAQLTKGQLEVLGMLAKGMSNSEIALKRGVGLRAVEQTIHRIYMALDLGKKGDISTRVAAARIYSSEMGLRRGVK
jgi:DNA-binding NarL/FixJ family response regulator